MGQVPPQPKIYHITHLRNLAQIVAAGGLWSDTERIAQGLDCKIVGMSEIKRRRLEELEVGCHPATKVGQYVPFYFCPRSIMLYILHQGNHPDLDYRGGQQPIVHLQADLRATVEWAAQNTVRWAFSTTNAGARYASFYDSLDRLHEVNWAAVAVTDFRNAEVKDGKQAEFLVCDWFPWELVEKVGVFNQNVADDVLNVLTATEHAPVVSIERSWYY
ncbi:MAG: type II toxin-antitoxin system toxin DNA ADP-ribosyl transferase DarT [Blastocatellia bacterium]